MAARAEEVVTQWPVVVGVLHAPGRELTARACHEKQRSIDDRVITALNGRI